MRNGPRLLTFFIVLSVFTAVLSNIFSTLYCPAGISCVYRCSHLRFADQAATIIWCPDPHFILFGDLNNDGLCDVVCTNKFNPDVYVRYRTPSGWRFPLTGGRIGNSFCGSTPAYHPMVVDIDGDGYDDIICVLDDVLNDDEVRVYYIKGKASDFIYPHFDDVQNVTISSDIFSQGQNLNIADKSPLKRTDECTKYHSQCNHVTLNATIARYRSWGPAVPWCEWPNAILQSGDLDGDGYCDLVCHFVVGTIAKTAIMLYSADTRRYKRILSSVTQEGTLAPDNWCEFDASMDRQVLLDINRDGKSDIVCTDGQTITSPTYRVKVIIGNNVNIHADGTTATKWYKLPGNDVIGSGGVDPVVPCSVSLDRAEVIDQLIINPCENVTRNIAFLQANPMTVADGPTTNDYGSFCRNEKFISADIDGNGFCDMICHQNDTVSGSSVYVQYLEEDGWSYESKNNLTVIGRYSYAESLGPNINCSSQSTIYSVDLNLDGRWDLVCSSENPVCGKVVNVTVWDATTGASGILPTTAPRDQPILGDDILGPTECPGCLHFNVNNGFVFHNRIEQQFEVTCNLGFELRGNNIVKCTTAKSNPRRYPGRYQNRFPICKSKREPYGFKTFTPLSTNNTFLTPKDDDSLFVKSTTKMFAKHLSVISVAECMAICIRNQRCVNARFLVKWLNCKLYDFEALHVDVPGRNGNVVHLLSYK